VAKAEADIEKNTLTVYGNNLDVESIGKTVTKLNYNYKGQIEE
jgi:hypothetical protein